VLQLASNSTKAPTKVAGASEDSLWTAGTVETIAGWGHDVGGRRHARHAPGGATSFGEGCARAGKPGVYARVADDALREWIRSQAPAGVD
jgi:hypothetical protein